METVLETKIEREKGFLYVCKGNPISIVKIKAGRKAKVKEIQKLVKIK